MIDVVAVAEPEIQEPETPESEPMEASVPMAQVSKADARNAQPEIPEASEPARKSQKFKIAETEEPPKRKPGRPKKVVDEVPQEPKTVSEAHAKQSFAPRVPPKPRAKTRVPKENIPIQLPEAPAPLPFQGLSSAELVAELVNRRRVEERAMKANLYRSFVM